MHAAAEESPAKKKTNIRGESAAVKVDFVEHECPQGRPEKWRVLGPAKHVLQHGVVCDEDVRRVGASVLTRANAACRRICIRQRRPVVLAAVFRRLRCEVHERDRARPFGLVFKPRTEALDLIVNERIHRVEKDGPNSTFLRLPRVAEQVVENREQELLGLARTGAGSDENGGAVLAVRPMLRARGQERLRLVVIKPPVPRVPMWSIQQSHECRTELSGLRQGLERCVRSSHWGKIHSTQNWPTTPPEFSSLAHASRHNPMSRWSRSGR